MNTRIPAALVAFATLLASSSAFAWSAPIHKCWFPRGPQPVDQPIPCSYTNEDGQTFNGVVTTTSNGTVLCTGLIAPNPTDPLEAQSLDALYEEFGLSFDDAPYCTIEGSEEGEAAVCYDPGYEPWNDDIQAAVQVCGEGWCLELTAYTDCSDYWASEPHMQGSVDCYDIV